MTMQETLDILEPGETSRTKRLRERTHSAHDQLDKRIMAGRPFEAVGRYGLFLKVQYQFHRDIDALYTNPTLQALLPGLGERRRLDQIAADCADIGISVPIAMRPPAFDTDTDADIPQALGWLYVAEGSNLGAAVLLKQAALIGLHENFGARHLAAHPQGRGLQWRTFTALLDSVDLSAAEEDRVIAGGVSAFNRVHGLVEDIFE